MAFQFGSGDYAAFSYNAGAMAPASTISWHPATHFENENEKLKESNDHIRGHLSTAIQRLKGYKTKMEEENRVLKERIEELESRQADYDRLKSDKDQLETQYANYYNRVGELENASDSHGKEIRKLENEIQALTQNLESKESDLKSKDKALSNAENEIATLKQRNEEQKEEAYQQESANRDLQESLDKVNADVHDIQQKYTQALHDSNEWQVKHRDTELKLESLTEEWQERSDQLEELQQLNDGFPALQEQIEALSKEANDLTNQLTEKNHFITTQTEALQKKDAELIKEKAARITAADGDANVIRDSLEDEFEAVGEELDEEPFEELHESGIITIADVAPVSGQAPTLRISKLATAETMPVVLPAQELDFSSINSASTEPVETKPAPPPELHFSRIEQSSTKPMAPIPSPSHVSTINTTINEPPMATELVTHTLMVDRKPSLFQTALPYISLLLVVLCAYLWKQLRAWQWANTPIYSHCNQYGAYGTPGHLFGVIPIGWDASDRYFSQTMSKWTAIIIQRLEEWAEIDRRPYM